MKQEDPWSFVDDKDFLILASGKYIYPKQMLMELGEGLMGKGKGKIDDNTFLYRFLNKKKSGNIPLRAAMEFRKCVKFTSQYLNKVTCPVLVAQGIRDCMVPYKTAYYLEQQIPTLDKHVIFFDQANHLICYSEEEDVLNQIVYTFLTREKGESEGGVKN
jgi:carboxylesterase